MKTQKKRPAQGDQSAPKLDCTCPNAQDSKIAERISPLSLDIAGSPKPSRAQLLFRRACCSKLAWEENSFRRANTPTFSEPSAVNFGDSGFDLARTCFVSALAVVLTLAHAKPFGGDFFCWGGEID